MSRSNHLSFGLNDKITGCDTMGLYSIDKYDCCTSQAVILYEGFVFLHETWLNALQGNNSDIS